MTEPQDPKIHAFTAPPPPAEETEPDHKASRRSPFAVKDGKSREKAKKVKPIPRKLTRADEDKIAMAYAAFAMATMPYNQEAAQVIAQQADDCAHAWIMVAEKNVAVRRLVVALVETSAWGLLLGAHLPIAIVLMPESVRNAIPTPFGGIPDDASDVNPDEFGGPDDGAWDGSGA